MPSRSLPRATRAIGASMLVAACASTSSPPAPAASDAGSHPFCPAGPTGPKAPASALPSGSCQANEGPCDYQGTPCPSVVNGNVNGYLCTCVSGTWSCEVVTQSGICAALPGADGATGVPPADAAAGSTGPTGPTGPAQP